MLINIFLLLSMATSLCGHQIGGRIYGGVNTSIKTTPYQVSLQTRNREHFCGGSIYSRRIIVTAAHCLEGKTSRDVFVSAGTDIYNSGGYVFRVSYGAIHRKYSTYNLENDVALLFLSSPLKFSSKIKPISLASSEPKNGATALVSGWGTTEFVELSRKLQSAKVIIVSRKICLAAYTRNKPITEKHICAAAPGKDSCQGDSGGPLVYKNRLVGIVSFGYGCANPNYPGVYTNVAALRDWIVKTAVRLNSKVNR